MSEPMEFWREMECSGVRSLYMLEKIEEVGPKVIHGRAIVRTQESDALFSHLCKFEKRYHLKTDIGVSHSSFVDEGGRVTHPPLSAAVSTSS